MSKISFDSSFVKPLAVKDGVQIWFARLDQHHPREFSDFLTDDEINRSGLLRKEILARYSLLSRGFLRIVLGHYLSMKPADVPIKVTDRGKPYVAQDHGQNLQFNVSHSGEVWVIAISKRSRVGIDIERIDQAINPHQSALVAFSLDERACLLRSGYSVTDFYQIWTAKEAVLKATGDGFSYPSNRFSVISSKNSSFVRQISDEVTSHKLCEIHRFSLFGDYTGAVAEIYP
jgi:4'-phosphopantetheinyl transferase